MPKFPVERDFAFLLSDVARLLAHLRRPGSAPVRDDAGPMGGAVPAAARRGPQAVRARGSARPAADHADPADRPAVRQRPDRAAERSQRPSRQAALSDPCGAGRCSTGSPPSARRWWRTHLPASTAPAVEAMVAHTSPRSRKICARSIQNRAAESRQRGAALWLIPSSSLPTRCSRSCRSRRRDAARRVAAVGVFKQYRRIILLVALPILVARRSGSTIYLMGGRYISTDNAYVGAAEGADHARHRRQDQPGAGERRPARQRGRRAVRDRSGAVPAGARSGAGQSRLATRAHRMQYAQEQLEIARRR